MKKPIKMECPKGDVLYKIGYNRACDEFEKFLPTVNEIKQLITSSRIETSTLYEMARRISKRLES